MGDRTGIEWTEATWNPIRGCSRVSEGCRNCYAEAVAARFSGPGLPYEGLAVIRDGRPRWTGKVVLVPEHLADPIKWKRPRRVFVNSMSDLFHETLGLDIIDAVFAVMAMAPAHTFQVLTKRPHLMRDYVNNAETPMRVAAAIAAWPALNLDGRRRALTLEQRGASIAWPLSNVWLGTSTEDQAAADKRIPYLLASRAAVRFVSAEPLIGPIQFGVGGEFFDYGLGRNEANEPRIHWVIAGGESGTGSRPMKPEWVRSIRDQCAASGVAFFFKAMGRLPRDGMWPPRSSAPRRRALEQGEKGRESYRRKDVGAVSEGGGGLMLLIGRVPGRALFIGRGARVTVLDITDAESGGDRKAKIKVEALDTVAVSKPGTTVADHVAAQSSIEKAGTGEKWVDHVFENLGRGDMLSIGRGVKVAVLGIQRVAPSARGFLVRLGIDAPKRDAISRDDFTFEEHLQFQAQRESA